MALCLLCGRVVSLSVSAVVFTAPPRPARRESGLQVHPVLFPAGPALVFTLSCRDGPPESPEMRADLIRKPRSQPHSISQAEGRRPAAPQPPGRQGSPVNGIRRGRPRPPAARRPEPGQAEKRGGGEGGVTVGGVQGRCGTPVGLGRKTGRHVMRSEGFVSGEPACGCNEIREGNSLQPSSRRRSGRVNTTWEGRVARAPRCCHRGRRPPASGSPLSRRDSMVPSPFGPRCCAAPRSVLSRLSSRWPFCPNAISG